ncbi:ABC transporter permease [Clostridia bacterium]|nr:ABC transporter permease [Clostridia bacterium]
MTSNAANSTVFRSIKACGALFLLRTAESLQYRVAALASASISIFWALIELTVYSIFYKYGGMRDNATMSFEQMASYIWLTQMIWAVIPMSVDSEILAKITNGDIGVELVRPLDLYVHWFFKIAAGNLGRIWWRALITMLAGVIMPGSFGLHAPASAAGFALFLCALVTAFALSTAFAMLTTVVRMGITWGEGPTYIMFLISGVLSGSYLPLVMWPDALQRFLALQPFAGLVELPLRLYVGVTPPSEAWITILVQLIWITIFITLGRILMRHKLRSIIVQGG